MTKQEFMYRLAQQLVSLPPEEAACCSPVWRFTWLPSQLVVWYRSSWFMEQTPPFFP